MHVNAHTAMPRRSITLTQQLVTLLRTLVASQRKVSDEMATDSHTKMDFVEFLEALGMITEIRVGNQHKLAGTRRTRKQRATSAGDDVEVEDDGAGAGSSALTEAEQFPVPAGAGSGVALAAGGMSPTSAAGPGTVGSESAHYVSHDEFVHELTTVVLNRVCAVVLEVIRQSSNRKFKGGGATTADSDS